MINFYLYPNYLYLFIHSRLSLASWPLLPQSLTTGTTSRRGPPPTAQASPGPATDAGESVTLMLSQDMAPPLESTQDTPSHTATGLPRELTGMDSTMARGPLMPSQDTAMAVVTSFSPVDLEVPLDPLVTSTVSTLLVT